MGIEPITEPSSRAMRAENYFNQYCFKIKTIHLLSIRRHKLRKLTDAKRH